MPSQQSDRPRDARSPLRHVLAGDGPLFFGSLAFAIAAVVIYFVVMALRLHG